VLDEPSIGLHPRDNRRLLDTLAELRDIGNTILVVEHEGGEQGGRIVASGTPEEVVRVEASATGYALRRVLNLECGNLLPLSSGRR